MHVFDLAKEDYLSNAFSKDCPQITVVRNREQYAGPGVITQDPAGRLSYKLFPTQGASKAHDLFGVTMHPGKRAGQVLGQNDLWTMTAETSDGFSFAATGVTCEIESALLDSPAPNQVMRGRIHRMTASQAEEFSTRNHVELLIPGRFEVPATANSEETESNVFGSQKRGKLDSVRHLSVENEWELMIKHSDESLRVCVAGSGIDESSDEIVCDILSFLFDQQVCWLTKKQCLGGEESFSIRSLPTPPSRRCRYPPTTLIVGNKDCWILFEKMFSFLGPDDQVTQLLRLIHSCSGIHDQRLSLAVAIEGISSRFDYFESTEFQIPFRAISRLVKGWDGVEHADEEIAPELVKRTKDRINGLIGSIKSMSAKDRLRQLSERSVIEASHVKTWSAVRNASAHSDVKWRRKLESDAGTQSVLDEIYALRVCLYRMIFALVDYEGMYVDYEKRTWPNSVYQNQDHLSEFHPDFAEFLFL